MRLPSLADLTERLPTIRVRYYGLLLLFFASVAPLSTIGYLAITRAEGTAVAEIRKSTEQLALNLSRQLSAYSDAEMATLSRLAADVLLIRDERSAGLVLDAFKIDHDHYRDIAVFDNDGKLRAGNEALRGDLGTALTGTPSRLDLDTGEDAKKSFALAIKVAAPVVIAGRQEGAVVAKLDLVGLWATVHSFRVGNHGFVRLLSADGDLIAHGDPEERRFVFDPDKSRDAKLIARAMLRQRGVSQHGEDVIAAVSFVPAIGGLVVLEMPTSEALKAVAGMRRTLYITVAGVLLLALLVGLLFGRTVVGALEKLRDHARVLGGGDLEARLAHKSSLAEVRELGDAIDEMAESLDELQDQVKAHERMDTFARVAAGLAHDLRQPIEAIRAGVDWINENPANERAQKMLAAIQGRDVPKLSRYIDDLRRLAQRGKLNLHLEQIDAAELANQIATDVGGSPKWADRVSFSSNGSKGHKFVADGQLVTRAISNLCSNAAEACMELQDGGAVKVVVTPTDEGGVCFDVVDDGPGIKPSRIKTLLSSDFKSTKRSTGVGLGLGVVRQVAESHGGELRIASELGQGSTFSLILPSTPTETEATETGTM